MDPRGRRIRLKPDSHPFAIWMATGLEGLPFHIPTVAALIGVPIRTLMSWKKGQPPRLQRVLLIEKLSRGKVPIASWG
jgi:hypothetical protein